MLISLDQFLLCWVTLGKYGPDETLSSLSYRWFITDKRKYPMLLIDALFSFLRIEDEHCKKSFEAERFKKHLPIEYK